MNQNYHQQQANKYAASHNLNRIPVRGSKALSPFKRSIEAVKRSIETDKIADLSLSNMAIKETYNKMDDDDVNLQDVVEASRHGGLGRFMTFAEVRNLVRASENKLIMKISNQNLAIKNIEQSHGKVMVDLDNENQEIKTNKSMEMGDIN